MPRRVLAALLALTFGACAESVAPPTITSVAFDTDALTMLTEDELATQVTVTNSRGETVTGPTVTYSSSAGYIAAVDASSDWRP
jgi:hypothetical protein